MFQKGDLNFARKIKLFCFKTFKVTFISFQMNHKQEGHVFFIPDRLLKD